MKNWLTAILGVLCLTFFSCQKEVDGGIVNGSNNGNGNGNTTGLLKKFVVQDGSDSSVYNFLYDNNGKLSAVNLTTVTSGLSEFNNQFVERNSQGMIQKIITKASQLSQIGVDSLVAVVNSSSGKYTSKTITYDVLGVKVQFTFMYDYDASGRIVSMKNFIDDGSGDIDSTRFDYIYTGSNLTLVKGYDLSSSSTIASFNEAIEYDNKSSALMVGNEAFILNNFESWCSSNNFTKATVNLSGDPDTHIETWAYTYNASNKPKTVNIIADGQAGTVGNYYYY